MVNNVKLKHRLALRLARYSVLSAFFIGLLLSTIQVVDDYQDQGSQIDRTIQQILIATQPSATRAVNTLDSHLAREVVNGLLEYTFVTHAHVKDELGKTLSRADKGLVDNRDSATIWLTERLTTSTKIYTIALQSPEYHGVEPGDLKIEVDMDAALAPFYNRASIVFMSGIIRNVILALLLVVVFYWMLTRPIELLASQFLLIGQKIKNPSPLPDDNHLKIMDRDQFNELGVLCHAGNQFIDTVQRLLNDKEEWAEALKISELRLLKLIDRIPQLLVAQNSAGEVLFANQTFAQFYDHPIKSIRDFRFDQCNAAIQSQAQELNGLRFQSLQSHEVLNIHELVLTNHQNKDYTFAIQAAPFEYFSEPATLIVATDIGEQIRVKEHMSVLATHDSLTGLPNRMLLNDRLSMALKASQRDNECHGILFLDLDRFKTINDSQGHVVGDEVLKKVSQILVKTVRQNDTVARLGGDEFVILMQGLATQREQAEAQVAKVCDKIIDRLSEPLSINDRLLHIGVSIGVVLFPMDNSDRDDLLRFADTAMYQAKAQGRNQAVFYHQQMSLAVEQYHAIETELYQALELEQFILYYQPQVDKNGDIFGFEALIRWQHPVKGMIPPDRFVPVLESCGLIVVLGRWINQQCCEQVARWRDQGFWLPHWHIAINVSPLQFYQSDFIVQLQDAIESCQISFNHICVEITETVAIENITFTVSRLEQLKALGIAVALDDFGTGYSSFSYLKDLPLDILKIDRCFIKDLDNNEKDRAIFNAMNTVASSLSLIVIAEGIETTAQLEISSQLGCPYFQGYYFMKPGPPESIAINYADQIPQRISQPSSAHVNPS